MITKGIIEELISPYEVKVRVPILDRVERSSIATTTNNLNVATICSLPNCYVNLQVGDVVFVGFEDNTYYKAVILGHLSRDAVMPYVDINVGNLVTKTSAVLPQDTRIGDVESSDIMCLIGTKDNIQKQLNNLVEKIDEIKTYLNIT